MRVITVFTTLTIVVTTYNINKDLGVHAEQLRRLVAEMERQFDIELDEKPTKSSNSQNGDFALRIHNSGMDHLIEHLMASLRHYLLRQSLAPIQTSYLGMGMNVNHLEIVHFKAPSITISEKNNSIRVLARGGHAKILGHYSAVYRTIREGELKATIDDFHIELEIGLGKKKISTDDILCLQSIGSVKVLLRPAMPLQIEQLLQDKISERIAKELCPKVTQYVERVVDTARQLVSLDTRSATNDGLTPISSSVSSSETTTIFEKFHNRRHFINIPKESKSMMSVVMGEDFLNGILKSITTHNDIVFHLERIPQVQLWLRTVCSTHEVCVGTMSTLPDAVDGTGALVVKLVNAPQIKLARNHARAGTTVKIELSYVDREGRRSTYVEMVADVTYDVTSMRLTASENARRYIWAADYKIHQIEITSPVNYYKQAEPITEVMKNFMANHHEVIEKMMSEYITAELPIRVNEHFRLYSSNQQFGPGQITWGIDFKTQRRVFPPFNLS